MVLSVRKQRENTPFGKNQAQMVTKSLLMFATWRVHGRLHHLKNFCPDPVSSTNGVWAMNKPFCSGASEVMSPQNNFFALEPATKSLGPEKCSYVCNLGVGFVTSKNCCPGNYPEFLQAVQPRIMDQSKVPRQHRRFKADST